MTAPRLLFVSATAMEVRAFLDCHDCRETRGPGHTLFHPPAGDWACLVTGPGVFNTAAGLGACLALSLSDLGLPDLVVDVGIAGVFPGSGLGIGDLALADSDTYVHTGVGESGPLPFELIAGHPPSRKGTYPMDGTALETCRSALGSAGFNRLAQGPFLTVSAITDTREQAASLCTARPFVMESMEGAAAAHACALYGVPMAQVRAGSNITGDRDKSGWDIPAACRILAEACNGLCRGGSPA